MDNILKLMDEYIKHEKIEEIKQIKAEIEKEMEKLKGNAGCDYFTNNTINTCTNIVTNILDKHIKENKE